MQLPCLNNIFLCYIFSLLLPVASPKIISKTNRVTALRAAISPFQMANPNTAYLGKWQLLKLDGAPFVATPVLQRKQPNNPAAMSPVAASASIQFSPDGHFRATAGCNRLFGRQERVYPDFKLGPIGSTRMGCTTSAEQVFTSALATMTKARREDKQLILSNNAGREMLFSRY